MLHTYRKRRYYSGSALNKNSHRQGGVILVNNTISSHCSWLSVLGRINVWRSCVTSQRPLEIKVHAFFLQLSNPILVVIPNCTFGPSLFQLLAKKLLEQEEEAVWWKKIGTPRKRGSEIDIYCRRRTVERGAELNFSGLLHGPPSRPLRGPCIIVKFCFQTTKFWFQTDGRTDRRTDAINMFWAFLV